MWTGPPSLSLMDGATIQFFPCQTDFSQIVTIDTVDDIVRSRGEENLDSRLDPPRLVHHLLQQRTVLCACCQLRLLLFTPCVADMCNHSPLCPLNPKPTFTATKSRLFNVSVNLLIVSSGSCGFASLKTSSKPASSAFCFAMTKNSCVLALASGPNAAMPLGSWETYWPRPELRIGLRFEDIVADDRAARLERMDWLVRESSKTYRLLLVLQHFGLRSIIASFTRAGS